MKEVTTDGGNVVADSKRSQKRKLAKMKNDASVCHRCDHGDGSAVGADDDCEDTKAPSVGAQHRRQIRCHHDTCATTAAGSGKPEAGVASKATRLTDEPGYLDCGA